MIGFCPIVYCFCIINDGQVNIPIYPCFIRIPPKNVLITFKTLVIVILMINRQDESPLPEERRNPLSFEKTF